MWFEVILLIVTLDLYRVTSWVMEGVMTAQGTDLVALWYILGMLLIQRTMMGFLREEKKTKM